MIVEMVAQLCKYTEHHSVGESYVCDLYLNNIVTLTKKGGRGEDMANKHISDVQHH